MRRFGQLLWICLLFLALPTPLLAPPPGGVPPGQANRPASDDLVILSVAADPDPFSPNADGVKDTTDLFVAYRIEAKGGLKVEEEGPGVERRGAFFVETTWVLRDPATDVPVRTLIDRTGVEPVVTSSEEPVFINVDHVLSWDGAGEGGEVVSDGSVPYAVSGRLLRVRDPPGPRGPVETEMARAGPVEGAVVLDTTPPVLATEPGAGELILTNTPVLRVGYQDTLSGVDLESLRIEVNAVERTSAFTVGETEAFFEVSASEPLPEGINSLKAEIADRAGNPATTCPFFVVDTIPPFVAIVTPGEGEELPTRFPTIRIAWSDAGAGVEPASARIRVNGVDRTGEADFSEQGDGAELRIPEGSPLPEGTNTVEVTISDLAGRETTETRTFTVFVPYAMAIAAPELTDNQKGLVRKPLDVPLVVQVTDRRTGEPADGVRVAFETVEGRGYDADDTVSGFGRTTATVDVPELGPIPGLAGIRYVLGPLPGVHRVRAFLPQLPEVEVEFTAEGFLPTLEIPEFPAVTGQTEVIQAHLGQLGASTYSGRNYTIERGHSIAWPMVVRIFADDKPIQENLVKVDYRVTAVDGVPVETTPTESYLFPESVTTNAFGNETSATFGATEPGFYEIVAFLPEYPEIPEEELPRFTVEVLPLTAPNEVAPSLREGAGGPIPQEHEAVIRHVHRGLRVVEGALQVGSPGEFSREVIVQAIDEDGNPLVAPPEEDGFRDLSRLQRIQILGVGPLFNRGVAMLQVTRGVVFEDFGPGNKTVFLDVNGQVGFRITLPEGQQGTPMTVVTSMIPSVTPDPAFFTVLETEERIDFLVPRFASFHNAAITIGAPEIEYVREAAPGVFEPVAAIDPVHPEEGDRLDEPTDRERIFLRGRFAPGRPLPLVRLTSRDRFGVPTKQPQGSPLVRFGSVEQEILTVPAADQPDPSVYTAFISEEPVVFTGSLLPDGVDPETLPFRLQHVDLTGFLSAELPGGGDFHPVDYAGVYVDGEATFGIVKGRSPNLEIRFDEAIDFGSLQVEVDDGLDETPDALPVGAGNFIIRGNTVHLVADPFANGAGHLFHLGTQRIRTEVREAASLEPLAGEGNVLVYTEEEFTFFDDDTFSALDPFQILPPLEDQVVDENFRALIRGRVSVLFEDGVTDAEVSEAFRRVRVLPITTRTNPLLPRIAEGRILDGRDPFDVQEQFNDLPGVLGASVTSWDYFYTFYLFDQLVADSIVSDRSGTLAREIPPDATIDDPEFVEPIEDELSGDFFEDVEVVLVAADEPQFVDGEGNPVEPATGIQRIDLGDGVVFRFKEEGGECFTQRDPGRRFQVTNTETGETAIKSDWRDSNLRPLDTNGHELKLATGAGRLSDAIIVKVAAFIGRNAGIIDYVELQQRILRKRIRSAETTPLSEGEIFRQEAGRASVEALTNVAVGGFAGGLLRLVGKPAIRFAGKAFSRFNLSNRFPHILRGHIPATFNPVQTMPSKTLFPDGWNSVDVGRAVQQVIEQVADNPQALSVVEEVLDSTTGNVVRRHLVMEARVVVPDRVGVDIVRVIANESGEIVSAYPVTGSRIRFWHSPGHGGPAFGPGDTPQLLDEIPFDLLPPDRVANYRPKVPQFQE